MLLINCLHIKIGDTPKAGPNRDYLDFSGNCSGGGYRNRTGLHGFAIRCVTSPPTRREQGWVIRPPRRTQAPQAAKAAQNGILPGGETRYRHGPYVTAKSVPRHPASAPNGTAGAQSRRRGTRRSPRKACVAPAGPRAIRSPPVALRSSPAPPCRTGQSASHQTRRGSHPPCSDG